MAEGLGQASSQNIGAQLFRSQVLWLVSINVREPYPHVGDIRFAVEEGLEWGDITGAGADHPIDGIHGSGEHISPEKIWCSGIFQQGMSFVKNPLVRSLSHTILLRCVWNGMFQLDTILCTIRLKCNVNIFTTSVGSQDFCMGLVVVGKESIKADEP